MTQLTSKFNDSLYERVRETVELEIAEEIWRATADGSYAGFYILVPVYDDNNEIYDFKIQIANDTAAQQMGLTVDEIEGLLINESFPINIDAGYFETYKNAFLTGKPFERRYKIPEGSLGAGEWIQFVTPLEDLLVIRNRIAETKDALKDLEAELHKDRTELLERVIREAGHDLRTPMSIIKTSLYLAEKIGADNPEKRSEYQQQAREQVDRLNEILEELVSIAKMKERGMNFRVMDGAEFIKTVYDDFKTLAEDNNRILEFGNVSECCILVSEEKMYRAYTNIVRNAMTYTDPGDTITLAVGIDGQDVRLEVQDTGIGISEENMQKIFDRFYRVNRERGTEEGNQGMGLSIAKEIVGAHGGYIDVQSTKGVGTTFAIVLPRVVKSFDE